MSNDYYENTNPVTRQTLARADAIEAKFDAVEAGFDLLPSLSNLKAGTYLHCSVGGTGDAITLTSPDGPATYVTGERITFIVGSANTGAVTINRDGLGVKNFTKSGATAFASGDLVVGSVVEAYYDGTRYRMALTDSASSATAAAASASAAASSASSASSSASSASSSASSASTSASNASTSATNAANSATAAATSATNAATSATAAASSATTAATNVATALTNVGNGAVGTPSVAFGSDTNTGLYRVGADELGLAAGGALQASVDTSGLKLASSKTLRNSSGQVLSGNSPEDLLLRATAFTAGATSDHSVTFTGYEKIRIVLDGIALSGAGGTNLGLALRHAGGGVNLITIQDTCDTIIGATAATADRYSGTFEFTLYETTFGGTLFFVDVNLARWMGYDASAGTITRVAATLGVSPPPGHTAIPDTIRLTIGGGPNFNASAGVLKVYGRRRAS